LVECFFFVLKNELNLSVLVELIYLCVTEPGCIAGKYVAYWS